MPFSSRSLRCSQSSELITQRPRLTRSFGSYGGIVDEQVQIDVTNCRDACAATTATFAEIRRPRRRATGGAAGRDDRIVRATARARHANA